MLNWEPLNPISCKTDTKSHWVLNIVLYCTLVVYRSVGTLLFLAFLSVRKMIVALFPVFLHSEKRSLFCFVVRCLIKQWPQPVISYCHHLQVCWWHWQQQRHNILQISQNFGKMLKSCLATTAHPLLFLSQQYSIHCLWCIQREM